MYGCIDEADVGVKDVLENIDGTFVFTGIEFESDVKAKSSGECNGTVEDASFREV